MKEFEIYLLEKRRMQPSSVLYYLALVNRFKQWLLIENLTPAQTGSNDLLNYLAYLQNQQATLGVQRASLTAIRHYFNYLMGSDPRQPFNPASALYLKNRRKTVPLTAIPLQDLHRLYQEYPTQTAHDLQNKVVTGLLVYQGIAVKELRHLALKHIDLQAGLLHIPNQHRINGRVLKLEGNQVFYLQAYIYQRHLAAPGELLLPFMRFPNNYFKGFITQLRGILADLKNLAHIRQSVIQHWSAQHDIRIVQYMAGHKWVGSTQRYDVGSLETLKAEIHQYHPLNTRT